MKTKMLTIVLILCAPGLIVAKRPAAAAQKPTAAPSKATTQSQATSASAKETIDPAKDAAIRKLFDVQGTKESMRQVMTGMTSNMRPILESSLPPGEYRAQLIELFLQKFQSKLGVDQLVELAIPVYEKYFSLEEIDGLTKFYQTPIGKKAISVLPQILLETQTAGSKLGQQIGRQAMMEVLAEHPDLQKALEAASATRNPS